MAKKSGVCDHKKELASFLQCSCVNSIVFVRQFYRVLTPKLMTVRTRKRFCPQAESVCPQAGVGVSTCRFRGVRTAEHSPVGGGTDLPQPQGRNKVA